MAARSQCNRSDGIIWDAQNLTMAGEDHFARLGLSRQFNLDSEEIEKNYLLRSREVHPDYHQLSSAAQQRASMEMTASLNEAYNALREPFRRAEYLLQLEGGPSASESKDVAPDFLEEMLELRMEIEELRAGGDPDSAEIAQMEQQLQQRRTKLLNQVANQFEQLKQASEEKRKPILKLIRQILNTLRFVQGLMRDLRAD